MSVKKYDVVFSLGAACLCSQMLRKKDLQFSSYPLDWVANKDFAFRTDLLVSDFDFFFDKEDLYFTGDSNGMEDHPCEVCINKRTGMGFPHDFSFGVDFETAFPEVKAKYDRRVKRLLDDIERNKNILIVYVIPPAAPEEQKDIPDNVLSACHDKITARFPDKNIDILCLICARDSREQNIGAHIRKIYFDFERPNGVPPYDAKKLRTAIKEYRLRRPLSLRIRNFRYKMKKRFKRWKAKAVRYLTFRPSL